MIRCGERELLEIMKWVKSLGLDAAKHLKSQDKPHAVYARKIYDESGTLAEVRLYCNAYLDDEELDIVSESALHDILYVAHKHE
jgi:hypothetical protein